MALRRYPEYKAVRTLGLVPSHWEIRSLGSMATLRAERSRPDLPLLSVLRERGVVLRSTLAAGENHNFVPDDLSNYKVVRPGDLVINKMKAWQGSLGISRWDGVVSPAYFVFELAASDPLYLEWLLRSRPYVGFFARASDGVRIGQWDLSISGMKRTPVVVPYAEEQLAIVGFVVLLDQRVNQIIRRKRRIQALLEEQEACIVQHAVTSGLRPEVGLRRSGHQWLGDIPEHWSVSQLRRRCEVIDCKHLTVPFVEEGIPLASVRQVQRFAVTLDNAKRTTEHWYRELIAGGRKPSPGDLIYCRNVSVGACALVTTDALLAMGQDVCLIRSAMENTRFINYFMRSRAMKDQLAQILIGSTFNRINVSEIKSLSVPWPPLAEQTAIADHLDHELKGVEAAITSAQRQIELLREYRTRLIADVVTGQLDVRGVALPPLDEAGADDSETDLDDADAADLLEAAESLEEDAGD